MYRFMFLLILPVCLASQASASSARGHLSVTAKANLYDPPGSAGTTTMLTVEARYRLSSFVSLVGSGGWTSYSHSGADVTYMPIAVDGIIHLMGIAEFDPYAGAGVSLNYRSYDYDGTLDDKTDVTGGVEMLTGVSYRPGGSGFGIDFDIKYRIEDVGNPSDSGSWSIGGGITGTFETDL